LGQALEFIKDQYRHCKTILAFGEGASLLEAAGIPYTLPDGSSDPGLLLDVPEPAQAFMEALARHKHYARETDPPRV
jgi:catalase